MRTTGDVPPHLMPRRTGRRHLREVLRVLHRRRRKPVHLRELRLARAEVVVIRRREERHAGIVLLQLIQRIGDVREILRADLIAAIEIGMIKDAEFLRLRVGRVKPRMDIGSPLLKRLRLHIRGIGPVAEIEEPEALLLLQSHQHVPVDPLQATVVERVHGQIVVCQEIPPFHLVLPPGVDRRQRVGAQLLRECKILIRRELQVRFRREGDRERQRTLLRHREVVDPHGQREGLLPPLALHDDCTRIASGALVVGALHPHPEPLQVIPLHVRRPDPIENRVRPPSRRQGLRLTIVTARQVRRNVHGALVRRRIDRLHVADEGGPNRPWVDTFDLRLHRHVREVVPIRHHQHLQRLVLPTGELQREAARRRNIEVITRTHLLHGRRLADPGVLTSLACRAAASDEPFQRPATALLAQVLGADLRWTHLLLHELRGDGRQRFARFQQMEAREMDVGRRRRREEEMHAPDPFRIRLLRPFAEIYHPAAVTIVVQRKRFGVESVLEASIRLGDEPTEHISARRIIEHVHDETVIGRPVRDRGLQVHARPLRKRTVPRLRDAEAIAPAAIRPLAIFDVAGERGLHEFRLHFTLHLIRKIDCPRGGSFHEGDRETQQRENFDFHWLQEFGGFGDSRGIFALGVEDHKIARRVCGNVKRQRAARGFRRDRLESMPF